MSRARLALLLTLACGGGEPGVTDSATSDATAASETGDTGDDATLPDGVEALEPPPEPHLSGTLPTESWIDATDRPRQSLAGSWAFRFDDDDQGIAGAWFDPSHSRADWDAIPVPATWDLAHPDGFNRQTVAWYALEFTPEPLGPFTRLRFDGVFREARVWLNGQELGGFDLPYLPFSFAVDDALVAGVNTLVVRVDSRITRKTLPVDTTLNAGKHGWWPYGGLTRPVTLEGSLETHVIRASARTTVDGALVVDLLLRRGPEPTVAVEASLLTADDATAHAWAPFELPPDITALRLTAQLDAPARWSPEAPESVYRLQLRLVADGQAETVAYDVAFREFTVDSGRLYLNDEDRFLRGINRHEDHPVHGPVFRDDVMARDLELITALGADFCRPGHYPNDVRVLQALERAGVMIAEEVPIYQLDDLHMKDPDVVDLSRRALTRMILRDFNRPGVVMWSVANELLSWVGPAAGFTAGLVDLAHALDPDRPVMVAAITAPPLSDNDKASGYADVIGVNHYWGWYIGETGDAGPHLDEVHERFPMHAIFVSEYGAGALLGTTLDGAPAEEPTGDHSYSEEWQAWFHERHLEQIAAREFVRGAMPWVLADFRMQWTPTTGKPHPLELTNLKGLVSQERLEKQAFGRVADRYHAWP
ncbi:MAG: hypothetical protein KC636_32890 [Myxococcales bacterium]|nr:hypothetical protein [Myxococcales bacterium]